MFYRVSKKQKQMSMNRYILPTTIFFIGILILSFAKNLFFGFEAQFFYAIESTSYWFFFIIIYTRCKRKNKIRYLEYIIWLLLSFVSSTAINYFGDIYTESNESNTIILRSLVMNIFLFFVTLLSVSYTHLTLPTNSLV